MTYRIFNIIWLDDVVEKLAWKHNVVPMEVEEVLRTCKIYKHEVGHREGEYLYNGLGKTKAGRYLSVFFILKEFKSAFVVTARDMTSSERKRYRR